jgi:hypothetical protein
MKDKGFITGESYLIKDIFSEDRKIVIPDLQRDYCWGSKDENEKNRVWKFIDSHYKLFKQFPDSVSQIGLIYGYKDLSGRIMLCDGQQRLTTLFLLIGMLNKKLKNNLFMYNLISKRELEEDDQEPYLQYAIRETSLSFISNLVTEFFLSDKINKVEDLNSKLFWFYEQYNLDPTVNSMLDALSKIEIYLTHLDDEDATLFGKHIINNLEFMYYDMGTRANGEETFVIINTSGEPLTRMENLKPFMVKNMSDCTLWENMDNWFWKNRNEFDTSDPGMKEFFRCVMYLEKEATMNSTEENSKSLARIISKEDYAFPYEEIKLCTVIEYFKAYKRLGLSKIFENIQDQRVYAWLIPSLLYAKKFADASNTDIRRIRHALRNTTQYRNDYKLKEALLLVKAMKSSDILSWLDCGAELDSYDNRKELSTKLNVLRNNPSQREAIEAAFADAEQHSVWHGELQMLITWAGGVESFNLSTFSKLFSKSTILFGNTDESITDVCIKPKTLRLLLAYRIANVMMCGRYIKNAGVEWKQNLRKENKTDVFYELLNTIDSLDSINSLLENYKDNSNFYYPIIKNEDWLTDSWYRDICRINKYLAVIKYRCQQKEHFKDKFLVGLYKLESWIHPNSWCRFYYGSEYIYSKNAKAHVGINIHGDSQGLYFYLYTTNDDKTHSSQLKDILEQYLFETSDNVYYKSEVYILQDSNKLIEKVYEIMGYVDNLLPKQ